MKIFSNNFAKYILLLSAVFIGRLTFAQEPIQVSVSVLPPTPNYAYQVVDMGNQVIITIQNTDLLNDYSLKMGVVLTGDNGITVQTKDDALPNQSLDISAGEILVFTGDELSTIYNGYTENDFDFIGISIQDVANDQELPDGSYTLCMRAYDFTSGMPLSASSPLGCSAPFIVMAVDPPVITYPSNEMIVTPIEPQLLNINWIPPTLSSPDLRYKIEMVDLTDMQMNPYDAFLTSDFLTFFEEDILINTFLYGMEFPQLFVGHEYGLRVKAYGTNGLLNIKNNGYSDIVVFTYGDSIVVDTTDSAVVVQLPNQGLNCGSDCNYALTGNEIEFTDLRKNSMVKFGNFDMKIVELTGKSPYGGEGVIQATTYMPIQVRVKFKDLKVDSTKRVFEGEASAIIRRGSWIDATWADIKTVKPKIEVDEYGTKWDAATNPDFYIDNLAATAQTLGTTIPISIGYEDNSIQIVGMNFWADRASFNLSYISKLADSPTGEESYLHFMAKDLCLTPGGPALSAEEARLNLVKSFTYRFDNSTELVFNPSNDSTGTFLTFDCDGFVGVHAEGQVKFDNSVFIPVDNNGARLRGDSVVASFMTNYTNWSDWVASVSFKNEQKKDGKATTINQFEYTELEGYVFRMQNAFIDHSITQNVSNMVFPENYLGSQGADWQGVYIDSMRIDLPGWIDVYEDKDSRVQLRATNLLVDGDGLTASINAHNVMGAHEGAMGKWPLIIDSVSIDIVSNSLRNAYFLGDLKLPVMDDPLGYTADIQFLNNRTAHAFRFNTLTDYQASAWFANLSLDRNSALDVKVKNDDVTIVADLNATISFEPIIGNIDKMNMTDITLEHLIIRSKKAPRYIEIQNIKTGVNAQNLAMAGFGILLESLDWQESAKADATGLAVGLGIDLAGAKNAISGETTLLIKNVIETNADSVDFKFDGTEVKEVYVEANTGAIDLKGKIAFFEDDNKFGDGFEGTLDLSFIESIKLSGKVLFGNATVDEEELNYWYAYAMAYMPNTPVPMATPLDIYGFGGGAYYNLELVDKLPSPIDTTGMSLNPRDMFNISKGILGIQASVVTALTPSSQTFNADVMLSAEIDIDRGGLNNIRLLGTGYIMQELESGNKTEAMVHTSVDIKYDFTTDVCSGDFTLTGDVPKKSPIFKINGPISFLISPDLWYFKAGTPQNPLQTSVDYGVAGITAKGYFMTGMQLPAPVLPKKVNDFFKYESNFINNAGNDLGIGFAGGVHLGLKVDLTWAGTGFEINGLAGVDLGVTSYYAATCNNSENFGINKWYAEGLAYVYADFKVEAFTLPVAGVKFGIIVDAAFPNPSGVKGMVKGEGNILFFKTDFEKEFQIGTFCDIQPVSNIDEIVERKELALEDMMLIGNISPYNTQAGVSVNAQPTVQFFKKEGDLVRYTYSNGVGGIVDKLFRFKDYATWQMKKESGSWSRIDFTKESDTTNSVMTYTAVNNNNQRALLHGNTMYKLKAEVKVEEFNGSPYMYFKSQQYALSQGWKPALYLEGSEKGKQIKEVKEHLFTTQSSMSEIDEMFVDYTLPFNRQRFYPYGYLHTGEVKFNVDQENKFNDIVDVCGFQLKAEFDPINGGSKKVFDVSRNNMEINFEMAELDPSTIYKMDIVAQRGITPTELANETNENCKIRNAKSLQDFMDDFNLSINTTNFQGSNGQINMGPGYNSLGSSLPVVNADGEPMILQRKILFTQYFGTSMYATPQEKMNAVTVNEVQMVPVANKPGVKNAKIYFNCPEDFEQYDIVGYDFKDRNTQEYFRFYGPSCNSTGMQTNVQNWYNTTCSQLTFLGSVNAGGGFQGSSSRSGDPYLEAMRRAKEYDAAKEFLWEVDFMVDASSESGYKFVKGPLTDEEVGLSSPSSTGTFSTNNYNPPPSSSSTNSSSNGGSTTSWTAMTYFVPFYTLVYQEPDAQLGVVYRPNEIAYDRRMYLSTKSFSGAPYGVHVNTPAGTYPLEIMLSNSSFNANERPDNVQNRKSINVYIPF